jgi:cytochrome c biogenesis protein CcdA
MAITGMIACFTIGLLVLIAGVFLHTTTLFNYSLHISIGILLILIGLVLKFVKTWDWKQRFSDQ